MDRLRPDETPSAQAKRLRELAAQWRKWAAQADDDHYVALMNKTAEMLETEADELDEAPAEAKSVSRQRR